ncbi:TROVE domain-containing protein [Glycomyces sp. NPDC047010]|uniref:TROVE domain-containing protein n=1 Tax=Glycomyces sp. NPDC047010 TaxID=3155023 RepID=UPI0033F53AF0
MGYMACLRNLRNFDEVGVAEWAADLVIAKLADLEEVTKSRQLPMWFLSAYRAAPSLRWAYALERALDAYLVGVPERRGRTLDLVDTSGSMNAGFSRDGSLMRWDAATVFGPALARRCEHADVVSFSNNWNGRDASKVFQLKPGESLLRSIDRWKSDEFFIGGGTDTEQAVRWHYRDHDRPDRRAGAVPRSARRDRCGSHGPHGLHLEPRGLQARPRALQPRGPAHFRRADPTPDSA